MENTMNPKQKQWNKDCCDSLELAKLQFITKSSHKFAAHAMTDVLEIEEFPSEPEAIHPVEEAKLLKALFMCHAAAVQQTLDCVIQMIRDGVLNADGDKASEVAKKLKEKMAEKKNSEDSSEEEHEEEDE